MYLIKLLSANSSEKEYKHDKFHQEKGFLEDLDFPFDPAMNFTASSLSWWEILCRSKISSVGKAYNTLSL